MSTERGTYWCYSCRKTVTPRRRNAVCPGCRGSSIQQLGDALAINDQELNQRPRFMEVVSSFLTRQQMSVRGNSWSSFLVFSGDMPDRMPAGSGGLVEFLNETLGFRRENGGDYFIGPGVEEFFEHVTRHNNQRVPQPASRTSIDALPMVKISKKHFRADSTCAVCKERFELGSRVIKLPCKHLYHSDCIVPWLEQRSSCPICRHQLTGQQRTDGNTSTSRGMRTRWNFMWPFGSSRSNANRTERVEHSSVAYHQDRRLHFNRYYGFQILIDSAIFSISL